MFTDIALQSMEIQQYTYSVQAVASCVAARRAKNIKPVWNPRLGEVSGYAFEDIEDCYEKLFSRYEKIMQKRNQGKAKPKDNRESINRVGVSKKTKQMASNNKGAKSHRDENTPLGPLAAYQKGKHSRQGISR